MENYQSSLSENFNRILEDARLHANLYYGNSDMDTLTLLDFLALFYMQQAKRENELDKKHELYKKARDVLTEADSIATFDIFHQLCRGYFYMRGDDRSMDLADAQFTVVLCKDAHNILALLFKACIAFNKKNFKGALGFYKKALRLCPNCPAEVRVGIAHCFLKLNNLEKATLAFERALQLNRKCVGALVGLAVLELNKQNTENNKLAVKMLHDAYAVDVHNAMVLNHLANHFFFRKSYTKVKQLALHALHHTENAAMRAESCYQLARCAHAQNNYNQAFQYYYQSTLFSGSTFLLPLYGLGQMYMHRGEQEKAVACFEKVLKQQPENYESMRILGLLYAKSTVEAKLVVARQYLEKVVAVLANDVETWIELAQLLEPIDLKASLQAYNTAMQLFRDKLQMDVPVEILNNVAALYYRLDNFNSAIKYQQQAISGAELKLSENKQYYSNIMITMQYNLARLNEELCHTDKADKLYKQIIKAHPNYIDCYLRLGCMARKRGLIFEASDFFKEALKMQQNNANARSLLANLHLNKNEFAVGRKMYESILHISSSNKDTYSLIALGNLALNSLHEHRDNRYRSKQYADKALRIYSQVLRLDSRNLWAINGIGAVLAYKGYINEAREIFGQVRAVGNNFSDNLLNFGHTLVEKQQYEIAITMYDTVQYKHLKNPNVELLQYKARAFVRGNRLKEAKMALLKAYRIMPNNLQLMQSTANFLQHNAIAIYNDSNATVAEVLQAVQYLKVAQKQLLYLSLHGDRKSSAPFAAAAKANYCGQLLLSASHHIERAQVLEEKNHAYQKLLQEEELAFVLREEKLRLKRERKERENKERLNAVHRLMASLHKSLEKSPTNYDKFIVGKRRKKKRKNAGRKRRLESIDSTTSVDAIAAEQWLRRPCPSELLTNILFESTDKTDAMAMEKQSKRRAKSSESVSAKRFKTDDIEEIDDGLNLQSSPDSMSKCSNFEGAPEAM